MSILIDSGVWIAFYNKRDGYHAQAVNLMKEINSGNYGSLFSTDYILDESVNYCLTRYSPDQSVFVGEAIINTTEVLKITQDAFDNSWELFKLDKKYPSNGKFLSFTDCTNIIMAKIFQIGQIATFDSRFKKYINVLNV